MTDIAHLGPIELLTPKAEQTVHFFHELMGMEIEGEEDGSVYLRGWGDYQRYSLKLTESESSGLGYAGLRAWSPEALERRVAAIERTGLGEGWSDGARGRGPCYRFRDPDGHRFELYYEVERYEAPEHLRPTLKNQPQRYVPRGCAVRRFDHLNILADDVRANRVFAQEALDYRLYERIELDDGSEAGAWMSATINAHELIYTQDHHHAHGRLHHIAYWVDTREECLRAGDIFIDSDIKIEFAPSRHAVAQGFFIYVIEPGGNRVEVTTGGYQVYDPQQPTVVWTEAERARGQFWGNATVETFHTYGTPPIAGDGHEP